MAAPSADLILGVDPRPCRIGCGRPARKGRRTCSACDHAIARYGDPMKRIGKGAPGRGRAQVAMRALLELETDECIDWPLHIGRDGYGYLRWDGKNTGAHVVACTERNGPRPSPVHEVAHSCRLNRACVNYRHLRWATRAENMADALQHGTIERGEAKHTARLTSENVRAIRRRVSAGEGFTALGREYGVSQATVHDCVTRRTWAWLDAEEAK